MNNVAGRGVRTAFDPALRAQLLQLQKAVLHFEKHKHLEPAERIRLAVTDGLMTETEATEFLAKNS